MKETDLQSLTVKAVRANGGYAHKLSNRFLVGVSDLLVKLPGAPAMLLEVKLAHFSAKTHAAHLFRPDVTVLQREFLINYAKAGMTCGILSFVEHGTGIRDVRYGVFGLDRFDKAGYLTLKIGDHYLFSDSEEKRHDELVDEISEWGLNDRQRK